MFTLLWLPAVVLVRAKDHYILQMFLFFLHFNAFSPKSSSDIFETFPHDVALEAMHCCAQ